MNWTNILLIGLSIIVLTILRHFYHKSRLTLAFLHKLLSSSTEKRKHLLKGRIYNLTTHQPNNMVFTSYGIGMMESVSFSGSTDYINNYNKELGTSVKQVYGSDFISYSSGVSRIYKLINEAEAKGYKLTNSAGEVYQNGEYLLHIIWNDKKMATVELSKKF